MKLNLIKGYEMKQAIKTLDTFEKVSFVVIGVSVATMLANYFINLF